ncbi:hypothetical protein LOAG_14926 [Loa loa]|nr:hypothetical protein LOAG_14926 [Loa loa]EFO13602.1 hypothetical protein LOAG_14926 [Loa loa]
MLFYHPQTVLYCTNRPQMIHRRTFTVRTVLRYHPQTSSVLLPSVLHCATIRVALPSIKGNQYYVIRPQPVLYRVSVFANSTVLYYSFTTSIMLLYYCLQKTPYCIIILATVIYYYITVIRKRYDIVLLAANGTMLCSRS